MFMDTQTDFRIIQEDVISFGPGKDFYLMLIQERGLYVVRLDTPYECVGQKRALSIEFAQKACDVISERLRMCGNEELAIMAVREKFKYPLLRQVLFAIETHDMRYSFSHVCKLKRRYRYRTEPRVEDVIWEDKSYNKHIAVIFDRGKIFGKFVPESDDDEAWFKFVLEE